ncbi:hypothetical protein HNR03_005928 [Pseudomonas sp. JAI111]|nr:hypothetical protein [Pseudomonas sp. JAI111]
MLSMCWKLSSTEFKRRFVNDANPVGASLLAMNDYSVLRINHKRRKALAIALTLT